MAPMATAKPVVRKSYVPNVCAVCVSVHAPLHLELAGSGGPYKRGRTRMLTLTQISLNDELLLAVKRPFLTVLGIDIAGVGRIV